VLAPTPTYQVVDGWLDGAAGAGPLPDVADVAVGPDDNVYVLARGPGRIIVISPSGEVIRVIGAGTLSVRPHGVAIDPVGTIYCVEEQRHAVARFAPGGDFIGWLGSVDTPSATGADAGASDLAARLRTIKTSAGPFNLPTHALVSEDGELFVTDGYGNAAVHRMTAQGELIATWGSPGEGRGQFRVPHYDCFLGESRLAVCDRENGRVQVFSKSGVWEQVWESQRPSGIAVDRGRGLVFLSEMGVDEGSDLFARGQIKRSEPPMVTIWTADGEKIDEISSATDDPTDPGSFILPHGIAVDSLGDLYVAETTTTYRLAREAAALSGQTTAYGAPVNCGPMPPSCHSLQKFRRRRGSRF
jgi:DNA-binding beta-propeller fold protein YncE